MTGWRRSRNRRSLTGGAIRAAWTRRRKTHEPFPDELRRLCVAQKPGYGEGRAGENHGRAENTGFRFRRAAERQRAAPGFRLGALYRIRVRRRVSGSGRFTGSGCGGGFAQLCAAFDAGGSAVLRLPGMEPFPAVFASLSMKGGPKPDSAGYEFVFLEDASAAAPSEPQVYTCAGGETLWDVAAWYGTDVDTLLAANPEIEWPNALEAGRVVTVP